jgi:hypothetical protein
LVRLQGQRGGPCNFGRIRTSTPSATFVPPHLSPSRYSVGTKNTTLKKNPDGSLTIYVQAAPPTDPLQRANWLPAPKDADFSLFMRSYWPKTDIIDGSWTPLAVLKA